MNIPVPEKPALADENSVEGLEAFTEWWFELLNYAYATGDLKPLEAVTNPGCETCKNLNESVLGAHEGGNWLVGGEVSLESFDSKFRVNTAGSIDSFITITQAGATYYNPAAEVINETEGFSEPRVNQTFAQYESDHWLLLDVGAPNTGEGQ